MIAVHPPKVSKNSTSANNNASYKFVPQGKT